MAKSQMKNGSKKNPLSSSPSKGKLKQFVTWNMKRQPVKKRIMDLETKKNDGESVARDKPIILCPPKVKTKSENHTCVDASPTPMDRAKEVQANLSPKFPSFVKLMLISHVTGGFWLGLPIQFCLAHLPKNDATFVLVDENEEEYDTKYLVNKNGLSAGWRGFSIAHKLLQGDVLVFQLIEPCKFKLYIVRATTLTEVDGAMNLLNLDPHAETIEAPIQAVKIEQDQQDKNASIAKPITQKHQEPPTVDNHQTKTRGLIPFTEPTSDQSSDDADNLSSEIVDGITFSNAPLSFKDVHTFEDFNIQVDGLILDSEIPIHLRKKYYDLCLSQNTFLHENLIKGLNSKLAIGMISETINIADAIRAVKPITGPDCLESWDRTLKAFQDLGFSMGFLRARIEKLLKLSREAQALVEMRKNERDKAEKEMRELRVKLLNVEKLVERLNGEIDNIKVLNEEVDFVFKGLAGAPW